MIYTWDNLCERADGVPYGHPALVAKDNARFQIRQLILEKKGYDIEDCYSPEEEIEIFLAKHPECNEFDEDGDFIDYDWYEEEQE